MTSPFVYIRGHWRGVLIGMGVFLVLALMSIGALMRWKNADLVGTIVTINGSSLTVSNVHGDEKTVVLDDNTRVRKGRTKDALLVVGDTVMVIGDTDEHGVIHARMIRVLELHRRPSRTAP